jgi:formylglycine-generating enzyme required for sulfatase activity
MPRKIFISYRRDDSAGMAGRLHDRLATKFGRQAIFMDVDSIQPGRNFANELDKQVASCDVFLPIIGPNWLDAKDENGHRRLERADDFVRLEIASALRRGRMVIPVLVDGAAMPNVFNLPDDLKQLVYHNAVDLRHARFGTDADVLIHAIGNNPFLSVNRRAWIAAGLVLVLASGGAALWWWRPNSLAISSVASVSIGLKGQARTEMIAAGSGKSFRDCEHCPEMVVVPRGTYLMGSPEINEESPQRLVAIEKPFAVGKFEVTRAQFEAFIAATGYEADSSCKVRTPSGQFVDQVELSWREPGYQQTGSHPVTCVNWGDTQAYIAWLSNVTGRRYRALSEAEWEYVARATTQATPQPRHFFGNAVADLCQYANHSDKSSTFSWRNTSCSDGVSIGTAEVGRYKPNAFGLYDIYGNVWELVEDCWSDNYIDAPADSRPRKSGNCERRAVRGGSWDYRASAAASGSRAWSGVGQRYNDVGFRVARRLEP